jgi:DNA-binding NtrC family response regulator
MKPPIAVIVDTNVSELRATQSAVGAAGLAAITVDSFQRAKTVLQSVSPGIVIAAIKLGAFNGLHLAALCAGSRPGIPFIVTNTVYDPVLDAEAKEAGAAYVVISETREELTQLSLKLLEGSQSSQVETRRWPRKHAPESTFARVASSEAKIVDVSYSGVRLRLDRSLPVRNQPSTAFHMKLPYLSLSLRASRVWLSQDPGAPGWVCGADLSRSDPNELGRWREFVDSLN